MATPPNTGNQALHLTHRKIAAIGAYLGCRTHGMSFSMHSSSLRNSEPRKFTRKGGTNLPKFFHITTNVKFCQLYIICIVSDYPTSSIFSSEFMSPDVISFTFSSSRKRSNLSGAYVDGIYEIAYITAPNDWRSNVYRSLNEKQLKPWSTYQSWYISLNSSQHGSMPNCSNLWKKKHCPCIVGHTRSIAQGRNHV